MTGASPEGLPASADDSLPVAARLVVEIRTDGSRTVARGALEDAVTGQAVAVRLGGGTPLELLLAIARSFVAGTPLRRFLGRSAQRLPTLPSPDGPAPDPRPCRSRASDRR